MAKREQPDFSSLKTSLTSRLGSRLDGDDVSPAQDSGEVASGEQDEASPYRPFTEATAFSASDDSSRKMLHYGRSTIRRDSVRSRMSDVRGMDIYPVESASAIPTPDSVKDEKLEAVIEELKEQFRVQIPQMMADMAKRKAENKQVGKPSQTKFQDMYDATMRSRYHGSAPSIPERTNLEQRRRVPANHEEAAVSPSFTALKGLHEKPSTPQLSSRAPNETKTDSQGFEKNTGQSSQANRNGPPAEQSGLGFLDEMPFPSTVSENSLAPKHLPFTADIPPENSSPGSTPVSSDQATGSLPSQQPINTITLLESLADARKQHDGPADEPSKPEESRQDRFRRLAGLSIRRYSSRDDVRVKFHSSGPTASSNQPLSPMSQLHANLTKQTSKRTMATVSESAEPPMPWGLKGPDAVPPPESTTGKAQPAAKGKQPKSEAGGASKQKSSKGRAVKSVRSVATLRIRKHESDGSLPSEKLFKYGSKGTKTAARADTKGTARTRISQRRVRGRTNQGSKRTGSARKSKTDEEKGASDKSTPSIPLSDVSEAQVACIDPSSLTITPLDIAQPSVPGLQYGLDRVLFNSSVYQLQDPHSRVYNFDPYLEKIMPVVEFDYNALKEYKTSSQDHYLSNLAKEHGKRYLGSTSSMTGTLGHFHYLISAFRKLNTSMMSRTFTEDSQRFTQINRAPNAIFLRRKGEGIYAIDADKEHDGANVLMMLGKSMEKLLTVPREDYERYRKENSHQVTDEERNEPEAFQYTTMGDFLMRSQLDAHDPRLPGTGMFDLKTRAVISVRMDTDNFEPMTGYEIHTLQGRFHSYEREYYDMIRSTMLKYMLQVRMGRMDGIFLAYHNVERIFGFQYVPLHEMDRALHGQTDPCLGNQEFKASLEMLNKVLDKATAKFPDSSLRLHFEASEEKIGSDGSTTVMWIYAEPMGESEIEKIQSSSKEKIKEFERTMMGIENKPAEAEDSGAADEASTPDQSEDAAEQRPEAELAILPDDQTAQTAAESPNESADKATAQAADETSMKSSNKNTSSTSGGDLQFAKSLENREQTVANNLKPLFAASIICKSQVDDQPVDRPERLKPDEKWTIDYLLQEWDASESMWARYEDMKTRRREIFAKTKNNQDGEENEENGNDKKKEKGDKYIEFLQSMSQKGRDFRGRMDALDAGKAPVVVGQPFYAAEGAGDERIGGLDDYMGWLYRVDASKS